MHATAYFFQTTLLESAAKKGVVCKIKMQMDTEWEVLNKSQPIPTGNFFFWFICTSHVATSGTALCGTTSLHCYEKHIQCDSCDSLLWNELYNFKTLAIPESMKWHSVDLQFHACARESLSYALNGYGLNRYASKWYVNRNFDEYFFGKTLRRSGFLRVFYVYIRCAIQLPFHTSHPQHKFHMTW